MSLHSHCTPSILLRTALAFCVGLVVTGGSALAEGFTIPPDQLDRKQIYYGAPSSFEKPAEVDYERVVRATPEFQEIQSQNIERGTGRYWILLSRASDRVGRLVVSVGNQEEYDLIASHGYLASLEPEIPAEDITEVVLAALESSVK
jgi:hypothetical protein